MSDRHPSAKTDAPLGGCRATQLGRAASPPRPPCAPAKASHARGVSAEKRRGFSRINGAPNERAEEPGMFFRTMAPIEVSGTSTRVRSPGRPSHGSLGGCSRHSFSSEPEATVVLRRPAHHSRRLRLRAKRRAFKRRTFQFACGYVALRGTIPCPSGSNEPVSHAGVTMSTDTPVIAYLAAGSGGMYCGSCLRDNTLAAALLRAGVDVRLIPTYTPIRTDEENVATGQVFFGGINVYLQQKIPLLRYVPSPLDRFLDSPWLLRWISSRAIQTDGSRLGAMTVSMLRGSAGRQRKEGRKLVSWLARKVQPDLINFSNVLIAGSAEAIKKSIGVPVLVTLQGDNLFLDKLPEPHRSQALEEIRRLSREIDGYIAFSHNYADFMADYLSIVRERIHVVPLGVDVRDFPPPAKEHGRREHAGPATEPSESSDGQGGPAIGYLARLAPEKGLHVLVDAFIHLRRHPDMRRVRLRIAGSLGGENRAYAQEQFDKLSRAGLAHAMEYVGEVDRQEKLDFLDGLDVFSVPSTCHEPKGIFVLEALAAGVPVVQPDRGTFRELVAATGGGRLFRPEDASHLAEVLTQLLRDDVARRRLGQAGREAVHRHFHADAMARATLDVYRQMLG